MIYIDISFDHCQKLEIIEVDENNEVYDSRGNCNAIIETSTNTLICGCKNTIIPNSVTKIKYCAFYGCDLYQITIPESVIEIEENSVGDCIHFHMIKSHATINNAYIIPHISGYHWEKNGVIVTQISAGVGGQGTYIRVED